MSSKLSIQFPVLKPKIMDEEVWSVMTAVPLWYNPTKPGRVVPDMLLPFMTGKHFLSTKQVPSALILAKAGSQTVSANQSHLLRRGFPIEKTEWDEDGNSVVTPLTGHVGGAPPSYSASLSSFLKESSEYMNSVSENAELITDDYDHSGSETSDAEGLLDSNPETIIRRRKHLSHRIRYEDPWLIHAASALANLKSQDGPQITVWSGDGIRLQDPLPPRILGPKWDGSRRNKIRFAKVSNSDVKLHIIYQHTHWGRRLRRECNDPVSKIGHWARTLRSRINRFMSGGPDPIWTSEEKRVLSRGEWKTRDRGSRSLRLIELLKTVDGIFAQRYLANPAEVWTWDRYDLFTLGNISLLLGDEFLDGELPLEAISIRTSYSTLKWSRKWFKQVSHRDLLKQETKPPLEGSEWSRLLWRTWKVLEEATGHERLLIIGILSQTRGCGTPPPLVVLQSKRKFLETVSLEPPEESATSRTLRRLAMEEVLRNLPTVAVTGLSTKSRVTVTSAACWEKTRREGGTTEQIKEMICAVDPMSQIPLRDLDTGSVNSWKFQHEFDTVGELIFWVALDRVLHTPPVELLKAFLTVVKEPGKARSVTKARACLKIVLDLVSKLCSEPLAKGIRSSQSGMSASNHGWNFFNSFSNEIERDEVFSLLSREETPFEGYVERTDTFEDLFVGSTDYEEATDLLEHNVAKDLGIPWMQKCGIPRVLQGIVISTCYMPREIYFKATGLLSDLGEVVDGDIHKIILRRGVLMGDPLTKPVLHLINVCDRMLQKRMLDPDFYSRLRNSNEISEVLQRVKRKLGTKDLSLTRI
ncbi:RNA-dependent RNA polymerase [Erysiphe necator associated narnavirus 13]|nr:RNA-dependent RNA polymerase [Erysiphe necator associated narnavirus 13]